MDNQPLSSEIAELVSMNQNGKIASIEVGADSEDLENYKSFGIVWVFVITAIIFGFITSLFAMGGYMLGALPTIAIAVAIGFGLNAARKSIVKENYVTFVGLYIDYREGGAEDGLDLNLLPSTMPIRKNSKLYQQKLAEAKKAKTIIEEGLPNEKK